MNPKKNNFLSSWIKASRVPSQLYILFPLLLGEIVAFSNVSNLSYVHFYLILVFSIFIQLFIVYANDYADIETDRINQSYTIFSGGSRVLVDGNLTPKQLKIGINLSITVVLCIGLYFSFFTKANLALGFVLISLFLLWAYSFPPIQLSYRGGGEILQTIGLALILPCFSYYIHTFNILEYPISKLWILFPTQLACAIATSLPDEPSDRVSNKRTTSVRFGNFVAKILILIFQILTYLLYLYIFNKWETNWINNWYEIIPIVAILSSLLFINAKPGQVSLSIFVFLQLLTTMAILVLIGRVYYFGY
jgi:1,4-dihydroxy-2-naphthoate octaprenyltransferase